MPDILDEARDDRRRLERRASKIKRLLARIEARIERLRKRRHKLDDKGYCLDGASMPLVLKLALLDLRANGWGGVVNSADRTQRYCDSCSDKMSQAELYQAFLNGTGAPANPPGQGSHEYVNGGTPAYQTKFPYGAKLPSWALGLDISDPEGFLAACKRTGYVFHRAYLPREPWHVNASENPRKRLIERGRV
jgi:hypothetical protein